MLPASSLNVRLSQPLVGGSTLKPVESFSVQVGLPYSRHRALRQGLRLAHPNCRHRHRHRRRHPCSMPGMRPSRWHSSYCCSSSCRPCGLSLPLASARPFFGLASASSAMRADPVTAAAAPATIPRSALKRVNRVVPRVPDDLVELLWIHRSLHLPWITRSWSITTSSIATSVQIRPLASAILTSFITMQDRPIPQNGLIGWESLSCRCLGITARCRPESGAGNDIRRRMPETLMRAGGLRYFGDTPMLFTRPPSAGRNHNSSDGSAIRHPLKGGISPTPLGICRIAPSLVVL